MQTLETYQVEDWGKFIEEHDIDLSCPACQGCEDCEDCGGRGYMEPLWDTIWNTGFHYVDQTLPCKFPNVFAFEYDDYVWFGLTCCGQDNTPYLAAAWLEMFPDCNWLPEQFIVTGVNLREGYVESCVGKRTARRIYAKVGDTIKGARRQLAFLAEDLKEARKHLTEKGAE